MSSGHMLPLNRTSEISMNLQNILKKCSLASDQRFSFFIYLSLNLFKKRLSVLKKISKEVKKAFWLV